MGAILPDNYLSGHPFSSSPPVGHRPPRPASLPVLSQRPRLTTLFPARRTTTPTRSFARSTNARRSGSRQGHGRPSQETAPAAKRQGCSRPDGDDSSARSGPVAARVQHPRPRWLCPCPVLDDARQGHIDRPPQQPCPSQALSCHTSALVFCVACLCR